ncbi:TonB-dependent siderophore receptor [Salinisphaera sp. SPP-AMP-43]|uniref:TonB-dependent receptor n=1 Tax=Salinisphaera sp. SPP-AMP-43 TaxID=3121288 RepID=UPI003C6E571E
MPPSFRLTIVLIVMPSCALAASNKDADTTTATPPETKLKTVQVTGASIAEQAREQRVHMGPLGATKALDTPYTVHRIDSDVLRDQQVHDLHKALSYLPSVQGSGVRPQTRGFQGSVAQNSRLDGLNIVSTTNYPGAQFSRIEVLNGLAGSLYGPASPAGTFNYTSKRPTAQPMSRLTFGFRSDNAWREALDSSGQLDSHGRVTYRLNVLNENGDLSSTYSTLKRRLISLATDFHLSSKTVIETTLSHYHYEALGGPGSFTVADGVNFPKAVNPKHDGYGAAYAGDKDDTETASIHLKHEFSKNWHLDIGFLRQIADRQSTGLTHTVVDSSGDYQNTVSTGHASRFRIESYLVHLNGVVDSGPIRHHLTLGISGFDLNNFNPRDGGVLDVGSASLESPQPPASEPNYPIFTDRYHVAESREDSLIFGDRLDLTRRWHLQVTASESELKSRNYDRNNDLTGEDHKNGLSTAASLIFKPTPTSSLYVTHADSLQQGDTAPDGATNAGQVLSPARSKEWEIGAKAAWAGVNYTLDAYQIRRPYALYDDSDTYRQTGKQRNRGIEFLAQGALTSRLHVLGGISYLDAQLTEAEDPAVEGHQIVGLPDVTANMLLRYDLPSIVGLSVSANARYFSRRNTNNRGSDHVSAEATVDLGASYDTRITGHGTTFRVMLNNATDAHYWTNIHPGGLNGYSGSGSASAELAAPRTVDASVSVRF